MSYRTLETVSNANAVARIQKDSFNAPGEFRVSLAVNGVRAAGADYFTDQITDAHETALKMIEPFAPDETMALATAEKFLAAYSRAFEVEDRRPVVSLDRLEKILSKTERAEDRIRRILTRSKRLPA